MLISAHVPQKEYRKYIGRSQFPKFVHNLSADKSIPEWVSRDNTLCKVQTVKNLITLISLDKHTNNHIRRVAKFGNFIKDKIPSRDAELAPCFVHIRVKDLLEPGCIGFGILKESLGCKINAAISFAIVKISFFCLKNQSDSIGWVKIRCGIC